MTISAQDQSAARAQSFTTKAVAVVALYWLGWIPGFVANILFYLEARRTERAAAMRLPGTGCLALMLGLNVLLLLIALAIGALLILSIRVNGRPLIG